VRTQYVSEESVGCVYETQDANKERGVRLSKDIVKVAGRYAFANDIFVFKPNRTGFVVHYRGARCEQVSLYATTLCQHLASLSVPSVSH
jgi:hypothetical protein